MRQKLNENPVAQIAVIAVLALVVGVFLLKSLGGGEESAETAAPPAAEEATSVAAAEEAAAGLQGSAPVAATSSISAPASQSLPRSVEAAYRRGETIVLLIYRAGGIDDRRVTAATEAVSAMPGVALFTAPAREISRYALITGPLGVSQAPALIAIRPRALNGSNPAPATVDYGFRSAADIRQAVVDAGYHGPELTYAPN
jgi:hypothetical protein